MKELKTYENLVEEINNLRLQLDEANETIDAIRTGQIDALIVQKEEGNQLYTLKTADQTYRVFIEKMNEGAVTINKEEVILYANTRFASIINTPLTKVAGLAFSLFIPEEFKETYISLIEKGWKSESKGEIGFYNENHELTPYLLSVTTLQLDEGTALSIILTDLTIQKENERQLKLKNQALQEAQNVANKLNNELEEKVTERTKDLLISTEYFKFLANNIPVIVWTALPDGNINYYNQRWYEYTGLTFEETKGWGWEAVLHPDDLKHSLGTWTNSLKTGEPYEVEYRFRRSSDDAYRWHLGHAVPFKNDEGNIVTWLGTCTDIEDQKQAMDKKDEFIGIASHELKTPLTSLKGYIQIIEFEKKELPQNLHVYVSKANESINKLQNLIGDLLDVSKIQAGKLEFSTAPLNVEDLINDCIENTIHIYPAFKVSKKPLKKIFVSGNFERLEQVVMNLISNAVKYSSRTKEIVIEATAIENFVQISITDFGIGISEKNRLKIFERFFRVEDKNFTTSGLGMGLYISSEIIKAHKGFMHVVSKLNEGSTFYFSLPILHL